MSLTAVQRDYARLLLAEEATGSGGMTKTQFAESIDVHRNTLLYWEKSPEFKEHLDRQRKMLTDKGESYIKVILRQKALLEMWEQYGKSKGAEKRQYLKMVLDETKDAIQDDVPVDYTSMSDEELESLCLTRGLISVSPYLESASSEADLPSDGEPPSPHEESLPPKSSRRHAEVA